MSTVAVEVVQVKKDGLDIKITTPAKVPAVEEVEQVPCQVLCNFTEVAALEAQVIARPH
jgi:hypothetical protein